MMVKDISDCACCHPDDLVEASAFNDSVSLESSSDISDRALPERSA